MSFRAFAEKKIPTLSNCGGFKTEKLRKIILAYLARIYGLPEYIEGYASNY